MRLVSCDACYYDNSIWFVDKDLSALFRVPDKKGICKLVCSLPREKNLFFPYSNVVACKGKIVCVPGASRFISIYNIKEDTMTCISIRNIERKEDLFFFPGDRNVFEAAVAYKNFVYMFGGSHGCILKLDVESNKVEVFKKACGSLLELAYPQSSHQSFFRRDFAMIDDTVWLASYLTDAVLEYHLADDSYEIHKPGYSEEGYTGICYGGKEGEFCLMTENEGALIFWNKNQNEIRKHISLDRESPELEPCRLLYGFGNIYVFMQNHARAYLYSIQRDTIRLRNFTDSTDTALDYPRYQYVHIFEGKIYVSAADTSAVYVFNEALAQHNRISWNIEIDQLQDQPITMRADLLEKDEDYIEKNRKITCMEEKINYGQEIYNYLKQFN